MPLLFLVLPALLSASPGPAPGAAAGISLTEAFPPEELALDPGFAIAVLTIVRTSGNGTNGRPPALVVRIDHTLVGTLLPARSSGLGSDERAARWSPRPSGVDWSGGEATRLVRAWERTRLPSPAAGDRLIALVALDEPLSVEHALREAWSPEAEARWVAAIARAREGRARAAREAAREAEQSLVAERERQASADLEALVAAADTIVVARLTTFQHSGESHEVSLLIERALRGPRAGERLHLVAPAEGARYVEDTPVIVFARHTRWPSRFGGERDGLRLVSPTHGILPATPERVARVVELVRPQVP